MSKSKSKWSVESKTGKVVKRTETREEARAYCRAKGIPQSRIKSA